MTIGDCVAIGSGICTGRKDVPAAIRLEENVAHRVLCHGLKAAGTVVLERETVEETAFARQVDDLYGCGIKDVHTISEAAGLSVRQHFDVLAEYLGLITYEDSIRLPAVADDIMNGTCLSAS